MYDAFYIIHRLIKISHFLLSHFIKSFLFKHGMYEMYVSGGLTHGRRVIAVPILAHFFVFFLFGKYPETYISYMTS